MNQFTKWMKSPRSIMLAANVPKSISFERPISKELLSVDTESTDTTSADAADELQALNTALCFLASINADIEAVLAFLMAHPQSLLLEGTGSGPEESARFIVEQQLRCCECFSPACNQNRLHVLIALDKGFEYYDLQRWCQPPDKLRPIDASYLDELVQLERQMRCWRSEELVLRQRLIESANEVRVYQRNIKHVRQQRKATLASILCSAKHNDSTGKLSVLEHRLGVAQTNYGCVEREHTTLLRHLRNGRQLQFNLLKYAFSGCQRHVCSSLEEKSV